MDDESMNQWIHEFNESMSQWIHEPMNQWITDLMHEWLCEWMNQCLVLLLYRLLHPRKDDVLELR